MPATESPETRPSKALALFDGVRWLIACALIFDAARSVFSPDASLAGLLVRLPGGAALPAGAGLLLGLALLWRRRLSLLVLGAFAVLVLANVVEFYVLLAGGLAAAAVPFSLLSLLLLVGAIARVLHDGPAARWWWSVVGALVSVPVLLLSHLLLFGTTDYARPADAIVVFGCRAYEDGRPSLALDDRVKHGIALYHDGIAPLIVMSGGPGEPDVMRRLAIEAGVPAESIIMDRAGFDTRATVANLRQRRIVAVSHYYHLARIKLTASRIGLSCATSPCPMTRRLRREPWFVFRECAAFVVYYLHKA